MVLISLLSVVHVRVTKIICNFVTLDTCKRTVSTRTVLVYIIVTSTA